MRKRLALALIAISITPMLMGDGCKPVPDADLSRITNYVAKRSELAADALKLKSNEDVEGASCYRKLVFEVEKPTKHQLTFYLLPDRKFVSSTLFDSTLDPDVEREKQLAEWRKALLADPSPTRGNPTAPITIVEFADFQCPYCQRFDGFYRGLPPEIRQKVRLVYKELPLPMHPWAQPAAAIAVCASFQSNDAFWQFHDFFLDKQNEITPLNITEHLKGTPGVDLDDVSKCLNDKKATPVLDRDQALASQLHVSGTPTVFVNGKRITVQSSDQLELEIHRALAKLADSPPAELKAAGGQL